MSDLFGIGDFLSSNSKWLKPVLSLGSNLYKRSESSGNMSSFIDEARRQEEQNFADTMGYNQAAQAYNERAAAVQAANSRASAAASAANQAAAMAAKNKATKELDRNLARNEKLYEPFKQTALSLLPQMTKSYEGSLNGYNMLAAYLARPENMAKLELNKPQWAVGAPIPTWAKK